jgi:hypothetical protein
MSYKRETVAAESQEEIELELIVTVSVCDIALRARVTREKY